MRSVWLSPGFPAAPAALLDSLGAEYFLAPALTNPPAGSIAVVTGFERDLLARLAARPASTSLVVITPPDAPLPAGDVADLRADAVIPAASIAEVADALRRLPAPAVTSAIAEAATNEISQDLPWWIRPPQDTPPAAVPAVAGQAPRDTAVFATTPLPAFGQPVGPTEAAATETLALGGKERARRRFALSGRQARIASIAAVVVAVAATGLAVTLDHNSSPANAAATSPLAGGSNNSPLGNSNGSNGFGGQDGNQGSGSGSAQGNGAAPQFGNQNPFGGQSGQSGLGARRAELEQFLNCLKQNGVSVDGNTRRSIDPTDPQLRTALRKCASLMPFGRLRGGFGGSFNGTGSTSGIGTNSHGANST